MSYRLIIAFALIFLSGCQSEEEQAAIKEAKLYITEQEISEKDVESLTFNNLNVYIQSYYRNNKLIEKTLYVCGEFTKANKITTPFVFDKLLWSGGNEPASNFPGVYFNRKEDEDLEQRFNHYAQKYCKNETINQ